LIAWLRTPVVAGPSDPEVTPSDRDGRPRASPWIDLAPATVLDRIAVEQEQPARHDHHIAAAVTLGGMYAAFSGWMYLAWYRHHNSTGFKWGGDGWLGDRTYAGGADKLGHAWSTMMLARLGTEMLDQWGGYDRDTSNLVSCALSEALFIGVEVRDGYFYEFSFSDAAGDTLGAVMAYAMTRWPRVDELFDFRVEYWPSEMYLRKVDGKSPCPIGGCSRWNIAEDYSGQTYLLAVHLGEAWPRLGRWSRYIDVAGGFGTRNYKPSAVPGFDDDLLAMKPHQDLSLRISFNAQGLFDDLLAPRSKARKVVHGVTEVFNVPFGSLPVLAHEHSPSAPPHMDGAL